MVKRSSTDKTVMKHYGDLLTDIKARIRQAQNRAIMAANTELVRLYWDIGRMVSAKQAAEGWGTAVIARLAKDLRSDIPDIKGFSERNVRRMIQFYKAYQNLFEIWPRSVAKLGGDMAELEIRPRPVAERATVDTVPAAGDDANDSEAQQIIARLPWAHNVILIQKIKERAIRYWYARQALEEGWSRDTLAMMIQSKAHERQGTAVTNFHRHLAHPQARLAQETLKDPYIFDFLTLEQPFHERELETGLVAHLERFLLELGAGFSFVGRQVHLDVAEDDFYVDLLFYHLRLRCFVVVDLKVGPFKPEYAGKVNFYCNVVDEHMRHHSDNPTIGLILCQDKKKVVAEYTLRGMTKPIGVSEYELTRTLPEELKSALPTIEEIEAELEENLNKGEDNL
jgi:predicted nuclease of restriction endonuclease-like (RecB) superfamily